MTTQIVFLYAAPLALLYIALSMRVIHLRRTLQIGVGDGGNPQMLRAMRVHANFAEYVPFALLMIFFVEAGGGHPLFVHLLGLTLLAGRVLHAFGVSQADENFRLRVSGMVLTFTTLALSAFYSLIVFAIKVVS